MFYWYCCIEQQQVSAHRPHQLWLVLFILTPNSAPLLVLSTIAHLSLEPCVQSAECEKAECTGERKGRRKLRRASPPRPLSAQLPSCLLVYRVLFSGPVHYASLHLAHFSGSVQTHPFLLASAAEGAHCPLWAPRMHSGLSQLVVPSFPWRWPSLSFLTRQEAPGPALLPWESILWAPTASRTW